MYNKLIGRPDFVSCRKKKTKQINSSHVFILSNTIGPNAVVSQLRKPNRLRVSKTKPLVNPRRRLCSGGEPWRYWSRTIARLSTTLGFRRRPLPTGYSLRNAFIPSHLSPRFTLSLFLHSFVSSFLCTSIPIHHNVGTN